MNPRLKSLVVALSIAILLTYVGTFAYYVVDYYKPDLRLLAKSNDAVDFIWTSASVLVGSVVAVALGVPDHPQPRRLVKISIDDLIVCYGWAWAVVGTVAIAVWILSGANAQIPLLIKNAATTFVGLVIPVVANFLKAPPAPPSPDS
jgi:hypothetical protein